MMTLSLLGSIVGFTISTNTTRNRFLDEQLNNEAQRISGAFEQRKRDVLNGVKGLSRDPEIVSLLQERTLSDESVHRIENRALVVRDRFDLDQVLVLNVEGEKRLNITPFSDASRVRFYDHESLAACTQVSMVRSVQMDNARLLVGCAPIWGSVQNSGTVQRELLGIAYTVQDMRKFLGTTRSNLGMDTEIQFADESPLIINLSHRTQTQLDLQQPRSLESYRVRGLSLTVDERPIELLLLHSEQDIDNIAYAGFWVMLASSGFTLVLVMGIGIWLAREFTRPILKLVRVARAVAAGDLSQRANFIYDDEIGQLGQAFDEATTIITELLDQRVRKTGELQAILQSMADGVLAVDKDERIVMVNMVAAQLLGQEPEMLLDKPLSTLISQDDPLLSLGQQHVVEQLRCELLYLEKKQADECLSLGNRIVKLQTKPTMGIGQVVTGAVVVIQDITQEVEADRSKSTFIATASHEMRTPLSGLKGFVDLFYMSGTHNLSDNQRLFLDTIKRQTDYLVQMVNDLLEVARFDQGAIRSERRWVALEQSLEESLINLRPEIERRDIDVQVKVEPELPKIWIDPMHLKRILINLLSNAVKYVHEGGEVRVWVYELLNPTLLPSTPEGQPWNPENKRSVIIEIEDNGVGIRESDQQNIFGRFFRSENSLSVEAGGTGLGLSITRSLVNLHNGQIGFWSVENEGTCFWVRLPAPTVEPLEAVEGGRV